MTAAPLVAAAPVLGGAAVELCRADGSREQLRRCDLEPWLGRSDHGAPRFSTVELDREALALGLDSGVTERIPTAELASLGRGGDLVIRNCRGVMTCTGRADDPLGLIEAGAVVIREGRIRWVGREAELAASGEQLATLIPVDAGGGLVTPGLIDCHAHPIFAGERAGELARRARGESYLEIARSGGGIRASVRATRAASTEALIASTAERALRALAHGTTTLEAKSGYDLTLEGELRLLEVARIADALGACDLSPTLLGAHAVPDEFADRRDAYVDVVCDEMVPRAVAARLCDAVDVYCDEGAFTAAETERILGAARTAGAHLRAHVGQFADVGGAGVLARLGGRSVDHLEQVSEDDLAALAAADVVAVMLPAACVQLALSPPPIAKLRAAGVKLAVASDFNPGTSHCQTLALPMWLAVTHYKMTVEEVWLGVTRLAAEALGRAELGVVAPGAHADLVIWEASSPADIPYSPDRNQVGQVIKRGRLRPTSERVR